jgi:NAD(P)-dependent dehydrogenase (short-subunit alcohol dehydrogenase family)
MLSFEGRTAIVAGAGRGLGRAYALHLAEPCADASASAVATAEGAESIVATAIAHFGGLVIVVDNAGVSYNVTRAASPRLIESGSGRVVVTTSSAFFGAPELVEYGAAKGGVVGGEEFTIPRDIGSYTAAFAERLPA